MVLYFHYHLKCWHIHDKKDAIEVDLLKSSRKTVYDCYYLKWHQINVNRRDLYLGCKNLRKWSYIFIITSNVGIFMTKKCYWSWSFEIKSNDFYHCKYFKWHQINVNRRDLYLGCKNFRKWSYIFIITSNVSIFMTKKVLLKLIFWNQVGWLFIIASFWNGIKLMWIDGICILVARN